jgi:peptidoglycan/LPS O-acetylase OafA/YrhL
MQQYSNGLVGVRDDLRLAGVDVLRGCSVLLVLLHHIHLRFWLNGYNVEHLLPKTLNQILFWSGYYAVIVFFVISGFLITGLSIRRWGQLEQIHVGRFYRMRAARILPCLLLLLSLFSALHLAKVAGFIINPARASLLRALSAALTFRINSLEGHHGYLPGNWDILWSLSVEETFYLLFPLACLLLRREALWAVAAAGLIAAGPISRTLLAAQEPWWQYSYFSCMDAIAFGCLTALVCARIGFSRAALRAALIAGAAISCGVLAVCNEDSHAGLARYGLNVTLLAAAVALMLLAFGNGIGNRALSAGTGWLRSIGRGSYEIYLVHMIVVLALMDLCDLIRPAPWAIPLWYAAMLMGSIGAGQWLARRYSEPLNQRLRATRSTARMSSLPSVAEAGVD